MYDRLTASSAVVMRIWFCLRVSSSETRTGRLPLPGNSGKPYSLRFSTHGLSDFPIARCSGVIVEQRLYGTSAPGRTPGTHRRQAPADWGRHRTRGLRLDTLGSEKGAIAERGGR